MREKYPLTHLFDPHPLARRSPAAAARGWRLLFALCALEALAALVWLAALPRDVDNGLLLGYSANRLALMGVLITLAAGCWVAARRAARFAAWLSHFWARVLLVLLPFLALAAVLAPQLLLNLYHAGGEFRYYAYYERLLPLFIWFGLAALQMFAWLAYSGPFMWGALHEQRGIWRAWAVMAAICGVIVLIVALTRIGLAPDTLKWGRPTVPLLEWQIWFAGLAALLFLLYLSARRWPASADWLIALAIWLLAAGLWLSQPVPPSFFATAGRAPNFEIYPFSDGAYYGHFAHSLLTGNGFKVDEIPPRPLYISLLAAFHAMVGNDYSRVIALQTLLLAFFPVVLYFLGSALHSRPAGLAAALLAILRELTAILTTPFTNNASNSKLFFADLPTALAISFWALLVVVWLKAPQRKPLQPLLVGGGLGVAMLFRTQSVFMLPVVLLLALLALRWRWKTWGRAVLLVLAGLILTLSPWLYRNYRITGQLGFDDPKTQTGVMAQHYTLGAKDLQYMMRPDEELGEFSERVNEGIINFILENPGVVARFVSSHFMNAQITNLLQFPVRGAVENPRDLLMPTYAFWEDWRGTPTLPQTGLILFNLGIVALGVGAAFHRLGWGGLALLTMNMSYHLSNALARNSGFRYLLPVDWTTYTYFVIGLVELFLAVLLVLGARPERLLTALARFDDRQPDEPSPGKSRRAAALVALGLMAVGSLPLLAERVFPQRYPPVERAVLVQQITSRVAAESAALERFAALPGARVAQGRALYPRFYAAGDGEELTAKTGYQILDYARTVLLVTGADFNGLVVLKSEHIPAHLPNASDVLVLGCQRSLYLDAVVIVSLDGAGGVYLSDAEIPASCAAGDD